MHVQLISLCYQYVPALCLLYYVMRPITFTIGSVHETAEYLTAAAGARPKIWMLFLAGLRYR